MLSDKHDADVVAALFSFYFIGSRGRCAAAKAVAECAFGHREGGLHEATLRNEFLKTIWELAAKSDALFIIDTGKASPFGIAPGPMKGSCSTLAGNGHTGLIGVLLGTVIAQKPGMKTIQQVTEPTAAIPATQRCRIIRLLEAHEITGAQPRHRQDLVQHILKSGAAPRARRPSRWRASAVACRRTTESSSLHV